MTALNSGGLKIAEASVNAILAPQLTGLRTKTEIGEEEKFRVINVSDNRQLNIIVVNPQSDEIEIKPLERVGNTSVCCYRPQTIGLHSLNVFLDRKHVPGSPFPIRVVDKGNFFN